MRIKNLFVSLFLFACFLGLYWLAVNTMQGQIIDSAMLYVELGANGREIFASLLLNKSTEFFVIVGILLIVIIGVGKRKYVDIGFIIGAILVSNVATQILKHYVLVRPDYSILYTIKNSFPSGHVTLITSVMFGLVLILPTIYRGKFSVIASMFIWVFGQAVCLAKWHRVSDVVGAILLTTAVFIFFIFIRGFFGSSDDSFETKSGVKLAWVCVITGVVFIGLLSVLYYGDLLVLATDPVKFIEFCGGVLFSIIGNIGVFLTILGVSVLSVKLVRNAAV